MCIRDRYQFGKAIGAMGLGHSVRTHFVQDNPDAGIRRLPGRFRASEAAADDMNGLRRGFGACHWHRGSAFRRVVECGKQPGNDNARDLSGVVRLNSQLKPFQPL